LCAQQADATPAELLRSFKSMYVSSKTVYIKKGITEGALLKELQKKHMQRFFVSILIAFVFTVVSTGQTVKIKVRAALYDRDLNLKTVPHLVVKLVPTGPGTQPITVKRLRGRWSCSTNHTDGNLTPLSTKWKTQLS